MWGQITGASGAVLMTSGTPLNAAVTEVSWLTTDAWPTILPGTAVGTIPAN